jgi:hypothetical protein
MHEETENNIKMEVVKIGKLKEVKFSLSTPGSHEGG